MLKNFFLLILLIVFSNQLSAKHGKSLLNQNLVSEVWVSAEQVKKVTLPYTLPALGNITAKTVLITPEIAGHVKKVIFKDGTFVEKDTPLFQLENSVYQSKYESTQAGLAYSKQDYQRKALLGERGAIAKQVIEQAKADLKEKQALAEDARMMLSKTLLRAPFAGKLSKTNVNPGDYVTIGQGLVTLTDTAHLRVEYNLPESILAKIKLGQTIRVQSTAYPNKNFFGTVSYISPTVNSNTRAIALYAELKNEGQLLLPGMFVNVQHIIESERQVILVPAKSLVPQLEGEEVYKVVDGKAYATKVIIGNIS